jgi:hypothetical protein
MDGRRRAAPEGEHPPPAVQRAQGTFVAKALTFVLSVTAGDGVPVCE